MRRYVYFLAVLMFLGSLHPSSHRALACVGTHPAPSVGFVSTSFMREDGARNWDFQCNDLPIDAHKVDWPVDVIYYGNATIAAVSYTLEHDSDMYATGQVEWGHSTDAAPRGTSDCTGACWGQSKGRKTNGCPTGSPLPAGSWRVHERFYTPGTNGDETEVFSMYNAQFGYYVFGTSHLDAGGTEGCSQVYNTGYSEAAETFTYNHWPYQKLQDAVPANNAVTKDEGGSNQYHLRSDGYASELRQT